MLFSAENIHDGRTTSRLANTHIVVRWCTYIEIAPYISVAHSTGVIATQYIP